MRTINHELSDQAKAHIRQLKQQGISHSAIARAAGIAVNSVSNNMNTTRPFSQRTAQRLLNVTPAIGREHTRLATVELATDEQATKCRKHITTIRNHGISLSSLAKAAGLSTTCVRSIARNDCAPAKTSAEKILSVNPKDIYREPVATITEMVREEYPFMRSLLGHDGAVHRLMDAYNISAECIRQILKNQDAA